MTMRERSTVVGVFADRAQAEQAIQALERAGFTDEQIGFIRRGEGRTGDKSRPDTAEKVATGAVGECARWGHWCRRRLAHSWLWPGYCGRNPCRHLWWNGHRSRRRWDYR